MLISEFNFRNRCTLGYSILGTDISERVLTAARSGSYTQLEVQRGLPAPLLIKYFTKTGEDRWTVKSEIRSHLRFEKLNLKNEVPASNPFDLILCRNVLIYQNWKPTLIPGGILALGSGESLIGLSDDYEPVTSEGAIQYRRIK
jgi:chemotaxis protein methyltransferase CheR